MVRSCSGAVVQKAKLLSFQGLAHLEVEFPATPGLYWITGDNQETPRLGANGVGKTSLWNALTWACAGKTGDGLAGPKVVDRAAKTAEVTVTLSDGREIVRTQSPNGLEMNGTVRDPAKFAEVFGCSWEAWVQSVHHAQGQPLFIDLSPADRAGVLSELLEVSVWEQLASRTRQQARGCDTEIQKMESATSYLKGELAGLQNSVGQYKSQLLALEVEEEKSRVVREARKQDMLQREAGTKKALSTVQVTLQRLEFRVGRAAGEVTRTQEIVSASVNRCVTVSGEREALQKTWAEKERAADTALRQVETEPAVARHECERLEHLIDQFAELGVHCKHCGQSIPAQHRSQHEQTMKKELEDATQLLVSAEERCEQELQLRQELREGSAEAMTKSRAALSEVESERGVATDAAAVARNAVAELRSQESAALASGAALAEKLVAVQHALMDLKKSVPSVSRTNIECSLKETDKKLCQLKQDLSKQALALQADRSQQDALLYWGKHFALLRLWCLEQALGELTLLVGPFLEDLGLVGWSLVFTTQKGGGLQQRLEVEVFLPGEGEGYPLTAFSGGERTRLRLAAQMALAASTMDSQQFGFEVWDEPSAYLSGSGLEDLLDILARRAETEQRAIFLVDHTVPEYAFSGTYILTRTAAGVDGQWTQ